jgi:hypothetical protein
MKATFIIGNGFDLALGMATSYNDFIQSNEFERLINKTNKLADYIKKNNTNPNWNGIENDLEIYVEREILEKHNKYAKEVAGDLSKELQNIINKFKEEYTEIKESLFNYLFSLKKNPRTNPNKLKKFMDSKIIEYNNLKVYNFNYTPFFDYFYPNEKIKHFHVHGSLEKEINNIIFGIKNNPKIDKKFSFIKKEMHADYGAEFIEDNMYIQNSIKESDSIYFYGFSFGKQDSKIIQDIFSESLLQKKITLIAHNNEAITDMKANLNEIISDNKFNTLSHKLIKQII